ncbi:uncharacterized protein LOC132557816 [Ylistrum balloti]|uniref:uncharacterized protein LOC132557816 n=1 Tax=Ylistrum balloti TaxID=509963 RepID=UPI0029058C91|nr:uncharacterized protein LOC132557816 [Ylistrum balloti]
MVQVMPCLRKFLQVGIVLALADVVLLGFGRAIQDDGRFLCFPSSKTDNYCICFDMEDSTYTYVPRNELPAQSSFVVKEGFFDDTLPVDEHAVNMRMSLPQQKRTTGKDVMAIKSLLLNLLRQLSAYEGHVKRSHVLSKRPFDSISYGSYFGGFGRK